MTIQRFSRGINYRLLFPVIVLAFSITGCGGSDESESSVAAQSDSDSTVQIARSPTRPPARERPRARACVPVSDDVNVPVILTPACDDPLPAEEWPDDEIGEGTDPDPNLFCDVVDTVDPIDLPIDRRRVRDVDASSQVALQRQPARARTARVEFCIDKEELTNEDLNVAYRYLTNALAAARENSAAPAIDSAVAVGTKLILIGETHHGTRPYYKQIMDRFVNRETDVVFIEANATSQATLDKYLAGRATMKELNDEDKKTINWSQILQHAKEKRISVKAIDTDRGIDRDEFMASRIHEHMTNGRYRRGVLFVGGAHLETQYNVQTGKISKAIPDFLRDLRYTREQLVDIHFRNVTDTAFYSFKIPSEEGFLWKISRDDNLTKGIVLETNRDTEKLRAVPTGRVGWVKYFKSPHTHKTAYAIVDSERELAGW